MKSLSIRGLPDNIYLELRRWAHANHRSLQEQVKTILEQEVNLVKGGKVANTRRWREKLKSRKWGNLVMDIRRERNR